MYVIALSVILKGKDESGWRNGITEDESTRLERNHLKLSYFKVLW